MHETAAFLPGAWEGFYLLVGTTAGALIGLQFVVLTLISEGGRLRGTEDTLFAFGSPNVVHFCAALLLSAIYITPWQGPVTPGVAGALAGLGGLVYSIVVLGRARRQRGYKLVLEDWIWHAVLPIVAYGALFLAGIRLARVSPDALFVIGAATTLLVFVGVHNAWDTVTYVVLERSREYRAAKAATVAAERHRQSETAIEDPREEERR